MIICPNCQHKEMSGAINCSKCGAQLIDMTVAAHKIHTAETRLEAEQGTSRTQPPSPVQMQSWISLNMIESGQILPLADRTEFTLGRSAECQWRLAPPCSPEIDPGTNYYHGPGFF
jgi:hypothetical protein